MSKTLFNVWDGIKKRASQSGFSLIEVVVVIALIAILTTIAVPMWQTYRANTDLRNAAREVMADIANAKQRAIAENLSVYGLAFNVAGNSYALIRTDTSETLWTKFLVHSFGKGVVIDSVTFPDSVIDFHKRGTASMGKVKLRNGLNPPSKATITVNITGRTYVEFEIE